MIKKEKILEMLRAEHIEFDLYEHPPIFSVEEGDKSSVPNRDKVVRNLFLCDAKKKNYYIVTLFVHKKIDLKELAQKLHSTRFSFGKPEVMEAWLGVVPGSVTPLAIANDKDHHVVLVLDKELEGQRIGMHPLENTATVFMDFNDLYTFLEPFGSEIRIVDL